MKKSERMPYFASCDIFLEKGTWGQCETAQLIIMTDHNRFHAQWPSVVAYRETKYGLKECDIPEGLVNIYTEQPGLTGNFIQKSWTMFPIPVKVMLKQVKHRYRLLNAQTILNVEFTPTKRVSSDTNLSFIFAGSTEMKDPREWLQKKAAAKTVMVQANAS